MTAPGQQLTEDGLVVVGPYDPEWPRLFEHEHAALEAALANLHTSIEHIGSTAVPGLAAKPIVDILIEAPVLPSSTPLSWADDQLSPAVVFARALAVNGYTTGYDDGGKAFLFKRDPSFNLWAYPIGDNRAQELVLFRDYLRNHPARACEYKELKVSLALEHPMDTDAYTLGKAPFVRRTLELAREAGGSCSRRCLST